MDTEPTHRDASPARRTAVDTVEMLCALHGATMPHPPPVGVFLHYADLAGA